MRIKHPKLSSNDSRKLVKKIVDSNGNDIYFTDENGIEYIFTDKFDGHICKKCKNQ